MNQISRKIFWDTHEISLSKHEFDFLHLLVMAPDWVYIFEQLYGIPIVCGNTVKMKHVKRLRKKRYALKKEENIEFVHGIGKRKSPLQKRTETLEDYLERLKGYTKKLHICGKRNHFSKTDLDATFMRMKEDAMGNEQ